MHNVLRAAFLVAFSTTLGLAPLTGDVNTLAQSLPIGESQLYSPRLRNGLLDCSPASTIR